MESFELWLATGECREIVWDALVEGWSKACGNGGARVASHCRGNSALRGRHPRTRPAAGNRAGAGLEFPRAATLGRRLWSASDRAGRCTANLPASRLSGPLPAPGSKIQVDGKDVGEITSAASLPLASGDRRWRWVISGVKQQRRARKSNAGGSEARVAKLPFTEVVEARSSQVNEGMKYA